MVDQVWIAQTFHSIAFGCGEYHWYIWFGLLCQQYGTTRNGCAIFHFLSISSFSQHLQFKFISYFELKLFVFGWWIVGTSTILSHWFYFRNLMKFSRWRSAISYMEFYNNPSGHRIYVQWKFFTCNSSDILWRLIFSLISLISASLSLWLSASPLLCE